MKIYDSGHSKVILFSDSGCTQDVFSNSTFDGSLSEPYLPCRFENRNENEDTELELEKVITSHLSDSISSSNDLLFENSIIHNTTRTHLDAPSCCDRVPALVDVCTPNISLIDFDIQNNKKVLFDAGYTLSEVDEILSKLENNSYSVEEFAYRKNRPKTHVFYNGRTFTYEKIISDEQRLNKMRYPERAASPNLETSVVPISPVVATCVPYSNNQIPKIDHRALASLKNIRIQNLHNVIIGQLNINSLRNKFDSLVQLIHNNLDILILTETKLDHTFPEKQFLIKGYKKPYRRDRNKHGGGVMIYVRQDIPSDILIKHKLDNNIEAIFLEINLRKNRLLLVGTYHSTHKIHGTNDSLYFNQIRIALDTYSRFDKFLLAGDFNVQEDEDDALDEFMNDTLAKNLVKEPTCFKNTENPSCIDLFITNSYRSFQHTTTVTTGLSDFHKMTVTVLKTTYPKAEPKIISYRTPYTSSELEHVLKENIDLMEEKTYECFENTVKKSIDTVSSVKYRTLRPNEKPYVTKDMRKAIMKRTQLQNKKFRYGTEEYTNAFKKHSNYCNRLAKRERRDYYNNLDPKQITDNKKFWKTVLPLFSDKGGIRDKIMLLDNDEIISDSTVVAEIFNNYFQTSGSLETLGITENRLLLNKVSETDSYIDKCITKFQSHPSIISIRKHVHVTEHFQFSPITAEDIGKEIKMLNPQKNGGSIPTKILIEMRHIVCQPLADIWNSEIIEGKNFSKKLKLGDITPLFKALQNTLRENYRPITVLVVVSKIFERIMDKQIDSYVNIFLSMFLCGYRKSYNPQVALTPMIEKWKMARDNGEHAGGVIMDLSKAFDTINHELLIAKLHAYGFSVDALKIVQSYLSDRWIRTKVDGSYSTWKQILNGMPQGSVNGPKWFNIYLNDLFFLFLNTEVCNIADDTTPYACNADLHTLMHNLESDVASAIMWFDANFMKLNQPKCHLLLSSSSPEHLWIQVGEQIIWESLYEKLLGVTIDKDLKLKTHVQNICNKASAKVTALARLIKVVSMKRKKPL